MSPLWQPQHPLQPPRFTRAESLAPTGNLPLFFPSSLGSGQPTLTVYLLTPHWVLPCAWWFLIKTCDINDGNFLHLQLFEFAIFHFFFDGALKYKSRSKISIKPHETNDASGNLIGQFPFSLLKTKIKTLMLRSLQGGRKERGKENGSSLLPWFLFPC